MSPSAATTSLDSLDDSTSSGLLRNVRDLQNEEAWRLFDRRYRGVLERVARKYGFGSYDSASLAQDVMIDLLRALPRFEYRPEQCRFRSYLAGIARNKIRSYWRTKIRKESVELTDEIINAASLEVPQDWDKRWQHEEQRVIVGAALDILNERYRLTLPSRMVLVEIYMEQKSDDDIARRLLVQPQDVYRIRSRWKKRLEAAVREVHERHSNI